MLLNWLCTCRSLIRFHVIFPFLNGGNPCNPRAANNQLYCHLCLPPKNMHFRFSRRQCRITGELWDSTPQSISAWVSFSRSHCFKSPWVRITDYFEGPVPAEDNFGGLLMRLILQTQSIRKAITFFLFFRPSHQWRPLPVLRLTSNHQGD